jgi:hypothetical protein
MQARPASPAHRASPLPGQKYCEALIRQAAPPFGDVARYGDCAPPDLTCQPKHLAWRKTGRHLVRFARQFHRTLPHLQVAKSPRSHPDSIQSGAGSPQLSHTRGYRPCHSDSIQSCIWRRHKITRVRPPLLRTPGCRAAGFRLQAAACALQPAGFIVSQ